MKEGAGKAQKFAAALVHAAAVFHGAVLAWEISIWINVALTPSLPVFLLVLAGIFWLLRAYIFFPLCSSRRPGKWGLRWACVGFGSTGCMTVGLLCFSFSSYLDDSVASPAGLSGAAASTAALALAPYLGVIEE